MTESLLRKRDMVANAAVERSPHLIDGSANSSTVLLACYPTTRYDGEVRSE